MSPLVDQFCVDCVFGEVGLFFLDNSTAMQIVNSKLKSFNMIYLDVFSGFNPLES